MTRHYIDPRDSPSGHHGSSGHHEPSGHHGRLSQSGYHDSSAPSDESIRDMTVPELFDELAHGRRRVLPQAVEELMARAYKFDAHHNRIDPYIAHFVYGFHATAQFAHPGEIEDIDRDIRHGRDKWSIMQGVEAIGNRHPNLGPTGGRESELVGDDRDIDAVNAAMRRGLESFLNDYDPDPALADEVHRVARERNVQLLYNGEPVGSSSRSRGGRSHQQSSTGRHGGRSRRHHSGQDNNLDLEQLLDTFRRHR